MTPRAVRSVSPGTASGILVQARSTPSCRRRVPNAYLLCRAHARPGTHPLGNPEGLLMMRIT